LHTSFIPVSVPLVLRRDPLPQDQPWARLPRTHLELFLVYCDGRVRCSQCHRDLCHRQQMHRWGAIMSIKPSISIGIRGEQCHPSASVRLDRRCICFHQFHERASQTPGSAPYSPYLQFAEPAWRDGEYAHAFEPLCLSRTLQACACPPSVLSSSHFQYPFWFGGLDG